MLQLASFGMQAMNAGQTYRDQTSQVYANYDQANRQAALNNGLAYSSYLHANEEQMLQTKAFAFDIFSLHKAVRRAKASEKASIEHQGGDSTFGSGLARLRNVERMGLEAVARKDLNFQTALRDFEIRRRNIPLETLDKNNRPFSGLSSLPSRTGLVTQIAGLGIDKYVGVGYYKGTDGKIKSRWGTD